jgi:ParB-like chromosome segregation protein Spo0J
VLKITYQKCSDLKKYERNSRTHSEAQIGQIRKSIEEFGFTNPLLVDEDGQVIAGHGRLIAAELMGMHEVPCVQVTHMTPAQKRAYIIADNKLAMNAGWDEELLSLELGELKDQGVELGIIGFSANELDDIFGAKDGALIVGSKELNEADYSDFEHRCPKCGFEFNGK